jgi:hypothetical protein
MKTWQQLLRENDPGEEPMAREIAADMREVVVRTGRTTAAATSLWPMRFALAAFACLVLMMSIAGTLRSIATPPEVVAPMAGSERRQIQFATPGGTRIIWEINPHFTLTETLP